MFSFSVMQSPFGFANVTNPDSPTISFIQLWTFERLDTICVVENNPKVNAPIKFIYTSLELFGNNFALQPYIS